MFKFLICTNRTTCPAPSSSLYLVKCTNNYAIFLYLPVASFSVRSQYSLQLSDGKLNLAREEFYFPENNSAQSTEISPTFRDLSPASYCFLAWFTLQP